MSFGDAQFSTSFLGFRYRLPTAALRRHSMARNSPPQLSMARNSPLQLFVRSPSNYNTVVRLTTAHH